MAVKSRTKFEEVVIVWLCYSIAALLAPSALLAPLLTWLGVPDSAMQTVCIIGAYSAVSAIAVFFLGKVGPMAGSRFLSALGYSYGLVIRASMWVRQTFGAGMAAALRD